MYCSHRGWWVCEFAVFSMQTENKLPCTGTVHLRAGPSVPYEP